jgi:[acyl-carrier-protein] S-malonyltransferase
MLEPAGEKLYAFLKDIEISEDFLPYVCNADARYVTDAADVKSLLMRQVYSSVRWQQSIEAMIADGVDTFVEVGPGKTLSGFMKKINREVKCINIATVEDLKKLEELNA